MAHGAGTLAAIAALSCVAQAGAAEFNSSYTDFALEDCLVMSSNDFGTVWACPGYRGYPLRIAEGDLRFYVSYGFGAADEKAAEQTPPPFNILGSRIEWRLSDAGGGWHPVATIVRYLTSPGDGETESEVLVVTRLGAGATCHVAYLDATANPDADEMAREAADTLAADFDCGEAPRIIGDFAAW